MAKLPGTFVAVCSAGRKRAKAALSTGTVTEVSADVACATLDDVPSTCMASERLVTVMPSARAASAAAARRREFELGAPERE